MTLRRERRAGFTVIELLIAMAMFVVLTAALAGPIIGRLSQARFGEAVEQIDTLTRVASRYPAAAGQVDYAGVSLAALQTYRLVPSPAPPNPWGQPYIICSTGGDCAFNADPTHYAILADGASAGDAAQLCTLFAGRASCTVVTVAGAPRAQLLF